MPEADTRSVKKIYHAQLIVAVLETKVPHARLELDLTYFLSLCGGMPSFVLLQSGQGDVCILPELIQKIPHAGVLMPNML